MTDSLGYRRKFGVLAPSTNTSVQPEYDALRPHGVTNHFSRCIIPDTKVTDDRTFMVMLNNIRASVPAAIEAVMAAHGRVWRASPRCWSRSSRTACAAICVTRSKVCGWRWVGRLVVGKRLNSNKRRCFSTNSNASKKPALLQTRWRLRKV